MTIDERINNLVKVAELHQQSIDKNTEDIAALIDFGRRSLEEMNLIHEDIRVLQLTVARLAEGYHRH